MMKLRKPLTLTKQQQKGMALIVVLGLMSVVFVVAAISVRLTLLAERSARNDRDRQIAFQAAEAALADAELDIMGPNSSANKRCSMKADTAGPLFSNSSCGNSTTSKDRGLCGGESATTDPFFRTVNFEATNDTDRRYVTLGEFTGRSTTFTISGGGGLSAQVPKYIIELVNHIPPVSANGKPAEATARTKAFLVTAVGYGTSANTKVMLQATIFKPLATPGC
jgi:type IV pilus assembly protein PilX